MALPGMTLSAELGAFDGKHKDVLEALAAKLSPGAAVIRELCVLAKRDDEKLQSGATWLLKRFQDEGLSFSRQQTEALLDLLDEVAHWEAKLHLLQILPGLTLPEDRKGALLKRFRGEGYLADPNKFLRAWAYNALAVLADQHTELRGDIGPLLAGGQHDEAASVRARIRNIVKQTPWVTLAES